jgi:dienelactone hydrolase
MQALIGAGLADADARGYLDSQVAERWDAVREGKFPLVLIGQGNDQDALDQAVLAEIIASHGFVVATVPSPTIKSPMQSADDVGPVAQRQAEDLLNAAARLAALGIADPTRMAVVGHSFGARAALLLAMHDPRVVAVVSLDGGIGTATALESYTKAPWFSRERATAPTLHFYETVESFMVPDFSLLRSLPSRDLTLRELKGLRHAHFTTMGFQAAVNAPMRRLTNMDPDGPASVLALTNELIRFLSAHVTKAR